MQRCEPGTSLCLCRDFRDLVVVDNELNVVVYICEYGH
jgi:hypothetical protein